MENRQDIKAPPKDDIAYGKHIDTLAENQKESKREFEAALDHKLRA